MSKIARGPYAKTIKKAHTAALEMRRGTMAVAFREAHKFPLVSAKEYENEIVFRLPSQNKVIGKYIEQLEALDDMIKNLSKFI